MTEGPGQVPTPERKERSDDRPTTSEGSDEEDDRGTERVGGVHQEPTRRARIEERRSAGVTTHQGDRSPTKEVDS